MAATRVIKKYPNRRLYDTEISSYITIEDVRQLIVDGEQFEVRDAKSGEDLAAGGFKCACGHAESLCAPRITLSNQSRNSAGTLPPFAESSRMVRLCSQTLSSALPE